MRSLVFCGILAVISAVAVLSCEKEAPVDPGGGGTGGGGLTDTIFFTVNGIKVSNGNVYDISYTGAKVRGMFESVDITNPITEHGYVWSASNPKPDLNDNDGKSELGPINSAGELRTTLSGLQTSTIYYVRCYVVTNKGTSYHPYALSFKTLNGAPPEIAQGTVSDIFHNAAKIQNIITDFKGFDVSEHGQVWGTSSGVDLSNCGNNKTAEGAISATDDHTITNSISGLEANTTYYFKAYATNQFGTSYSQAKEFTTAGLPAPNIIIESYSYTEPNGSGNVNPGENVTLTFTLKNTGNAEATGVNLSIADGPFYDIVTPLPATVGTILPGSSVQRSVAITISSQTPWNTIITIPVTIRDDALRTWTNSNGATLNVISPYVVDEGLAFYLRFQECAGNTVQSVVGSNPGSNFGATFSPDIIPGTTGCSMNFTGSQGNYIQFPYNPLQNFSTVSFSFWMKTTAANAALFHANTDGTSSGFYLTIKNNKFDGYASSLDFNYDLAQSGALDNFWHHFVLVVGDGGKSKLYIDGGAPRVIKDATGITATGEDGFSLGKCSWSSQFTDPPLNGKIDNFRIYNRALSQEHVQKIFDAKQ